MIRLAKRKQTGVATIEFVLGFMAFWLMCMAWVEMSYLSYISAISTVCSIHWGGSRFDEC